MPEGETRPASFLAHALSAGAVESGPVPAQPPQESEQGTFILIESHAMIRHLLCEELRARLGLRCQGEFDTLEAGLLACNGREPALLIFAWEHEKRLPPGQVREAVLRLPRTHFLALLSQRRAHVVREIFDAGVQGCVLKHAPIGEFIKAVTRLLAGEIFYDTESSQLLLQSFRDPGIRKSMSLTQRERDILGTIAAGECLRSLADRLGVSPKTLKNQLYALKRKLGIRDIPGLVRFALRNGLGDGVN